MPKHQPAPQPDASGWTVSESDWAHLHGRVDTLESSVRIVAAGHQLLAEQMAEITVSQHRSGQRLDKISTELADNSKTTREILGATRDLRDVVITARTGGKFARWLAPTLLAAAASIGVAKGWWTDLTDLVLKK